MTKYRLMASRENDNPQSVAAISRRLLLLRSALGYSQPYIASLLEQAISTWAMYETGERRISLDQARKLCARTRVDLNWIYEGDVRGLPPDLIEKLNSAGSKQRRPRRPRA